MLDQLVHKYMRLPYALHVHKVRKVKRPRASVLLLHGIGTSGAAWDEVIAGLPKDVDVISVDLLGFGRSPSPRWAIYNTVSQARSVIATLLKLRVKQQLIVVGHSMGALVAVEMAKRYPLLVKSLILCSPPFYSNRIEARRLFPDRDKTLKDLYRLVRKHPQEFTTVVPLATKYRLVEKAFDVTDENVGSYMAALEASIINQTALEDAKKLQKPIRILHGTFDPVVIKKNLEEIVTTNNNAELRVILAGHAVLGPYIPAIVEEINAMTSRAKST